MACRWVSSSKSLLRLYNGETLEPLRIQYKEFAAWQQSEPVKERLKSQEAYWLDMLEGELPTLEPAYGLCQICRSQL